MKASIASITAKLSGFTAAKVFATALCASGIPVTEASSEAEIKAAIDAKLKALPAPTAPANLAQVETDLTTAKTTIGTLTTRAETAEGKLSTLMSTLDAAGIKLPDNFTAASVTQAIDKIVAAKAPEAAAKLLADAGLKEDELPVTRPGSDAPKSIGELRAEYAAIEDPRARAKFYAQNIDPLISKAAREQNGLGRPTKAFINPARN